MKGYCSDCRQTLELTPEGVLPDHSRPVFCAGCPGSGKRPTSHFDLGTVCAKVIEENPTHVGLYLQGKSGLGFLVGRAMAASLGQFPPGDVENELKGRLR